MLIEYIPIIILTVLAAAMGVLVLFIDRLFGPRRPTIKKNHTYESGMVPYGPGTRKMSVRYYLIAVLFILFDVETIFFLPWAVTFRGLGIFSLIEMFIFIGILAVAYIYVWKKGALEWE